MEAVRAWLCKSGPALNVIRSNDDFPDCLACGSLKTKEHHFVQTWCRGRKQWESETLCSDCWSWSFRAYSDPDFLTPEEFEKARWAGLVAQNAAEANAKRTLLSQM